MAVVPAANSTPNSAHESPLRLAGLRVRRADVVCVALLVGGLAALFWRVIFTPAMFFYRDVFSYSYPHARFIGATLRQGHLPYWNPYLNFGEPVLANPNFLFFYPSTIALALLPVDFAYTLHYLAHFAIAGIGTYCLARRWEQSPTAALFAAAVFTFSGPLLSLGNLYNHAAVVAWIPWALLATDGALEGRSRRSWIILVAIFALQFLASEPFTWMATFGLSVAYAFYRHGTLRPVLGAANRRLLFNFVLVGAAMVAVCAAQFFPALDLLRHSRRGSGGLPFEETAAWSFHPLSLVEFIIPEFFGSPLDSPSLWTVVLNGRLTPYFLSLFVGLVPLFLALAGWAVGRDRRRSFAAAAALVLLLLAFGRFTPIFGLVCKLFPPLALVRFPMKLIVPALLLVSLLAGWGFDALRAPNGASIGRRRRISLPLNLVLGVTTAVWLVSWAWPHGVTDFSAWALIRTDRMVSSGRAGDLNADLVSSAADFFLQRIRFLLPGLAGFALGARVWVWAIEQKKPWAQRVLSAVAVFGVAQMALVNYSANPTVPKMFYSYSPPVLSHFEASPMPYRSSYVFREAESPSASPDIQGFLNFESVPEAAGLSPAAQMAFRDRLLLARGTMLLGVESVSNIDVEWAFPPFLYDFWILGAGKTLDAARADCLLGRANARYQVHRARQQSATARQIAPVFNGSPRESFLYENSCFAPRAFVAGTALYSLNAAQTLERLSSPDFSAEREVILAAPPASSLTREDSISAGSVEIVERQPHQVILRADLTRPAYVVLLDRFDPNWRATIDGREVPVLRANQLFRAVRAEAGRRTIRFEYHQRALSAGLAVTLATLAILLAVFALDARRKRGAPVQSPSP